MRRKERNHPELGGVNSSHVAMMSIATLSELSARRLEG